MEDNEEDESVRRDESFRRGRRSRKLRRLLNVAIWLLYLVFFVIDKILKFCVGRISGWFTKQREKRDAPIVCVNALLCGLSKVGKTSLLYSIKLGEFIPTLLMYDLSHCSILYDCVSPKFQLSESQNDLCMCRLSSTCQFLCFLSNCETCKQIPTVETYCEEFDYLFGGDNNQKIRLRIWDVARPSNSSPEGWRRCHWATDCVIFVVDAKDRHRIDEARDELFELMFEDHYRMVDARFLILANKQDVAKALSRKELESLFALPNDMKDRWRVVGTSAVTGQGLRDGLKWLVKTSSQQAQVREMNFLGAEDFGDSLDTTSIEFTSIDTLSTGSLSSSEKPKALSILSPLNLLRPKRTIWGKKTEKDEDAENDTHHVSLECGNISSDMGLVGEIHPQHHLINTRCVAKSSSSGNDTLTLRMKSGDGESKDRMTTVGNVDLEKAKSPLKMECAGAKDKRLHSPSQNL